MGLHRVKHTVDNTLSYLFIEITLGLENKLISAQRHSRLENPNIFSKTMIVLDLLIVSNAYN